MSDSKNRFYEFGEFRLDPVQRVLFRGGTQVPLQSKAFDVLAMLVMNPHRVITKGELLKSLFPESHVREENLYVTVSWLRRTLGGSKQYIANVPGRGTHARFVQDCSTHVVK